MKKLINKICFVIVTKDRPAELFRLLQSLDSQRYQPDTVIIVDAGNKPIENLLTKAPGLNIHYLKSPIASATRQRNIGIGIVTPEVALLGFLDDDIVLETDALVKMMEFWEGADKDVAGAAFNIVNSPVIQLSGFKFLPLTRRLGLYSEEKGRVLSSGFHTGIGRVSHAIQTQWLYSGATVWRRNIFNEFKFDEWFVGYSYLEDLDFSYSVGKKYKLFVLAEPKCSHFTARKDEESGYLFGRKEVFNRIYFVRKNKELSLLKCYLSLFIRMFISLINVFSRKWKNYLQRILGNFVEIIKNTYSIIFSGTKKIRRGEQLFL